MSQPNIRQALEVVLISIAPQISIAWENQIFTPVDGVPYAAAYLMGAPPLNVEIGANGLAQEQGIFQINLMYPANVGPAAAEAQAELIRGVFRQGAQFTKGSTTVTISKTPTISQGRPDGDRWMVPIKISYFTNGL